LQVKGIGSLLAIKPSTCGAAPAGAAIAEMAKAAAAASQPVRLSCMEIFP
jgi:hypothetical protein